MQIANAGGQVAECRSANNKTPNVGRKECKCEQRGSNYSSGVYFDYELCWLAIRVGGPVTGRSQRKRIRNETQTAILNHKQFHHLPIPIFCPRRIATENSSRECNFRWPAAIREQRSQYVNCHGDTKLISAIPCHLQIIYQTAVQLNCSLLHPPTQSKIKLRPQLQFYMQSSLKLWILSRWNWRPPSCCAHSVASVGLSSLLWVLFCEKTVEKVQFKRESWTNWSP